MISERHRDFIALVVCWVNHSSNVKRPGGWPGVERGGGARYSWIFAATLSFILLLLLITWLKNRKYFLNRIFHIKIKRIKVHSRLREHLQVSIGHLQMLTRELWWRPKMWTTGRIARKDVPQRQTHTRKSCDTETETPIKTQKRIGYNLAYLATSCERSN